MTTHTKIRRRLLASLCTAAMLFSMLPVQAFAEDPQTEQDTVVASSETQENLEDTLDLETNAEEEPSKSTLVSANASVIVTEETSIPEQGQVLQVKNVSEIKLSNTELTLAESQKVQLTAEVLPTDADDKTVEWKSENNEVASVDGNGLVTAVKEGTTTITAVATNGTPDDTSDDKTASCVVKVSRQSQDQPLSIQINNTDVEEYSATYGDVLHFAVNGSTDPVQWTSTDQSVATIGQDGLVTLLKAGKTTIMAQVADRTASCRLTVEKKKLQVTAIAFDPKVYDGKTDVAADLAHLTIKDSNDVEITEIEVSGLTYKTDVPDAGTQNVNVWGAAVLDEESDSKYSLELANNLSSTIEIQKAKLTATVDKLTYNGEKAGFEWQEVAFSGFAGRGGTQQTYLVESLYSQTADQAVQAGSNVVVNIAYSDRVDRDTINYEWPNTLTVGQVVPATVNFVVEVADKGYDGTDTVKEIVRNEYQGGLVGDDRRSTCTNTVVASDLQFGHAGNITANSDVNVQFRQDAETRVKILLDGVENTNYSWEFEFQEARITRNTYDENVGFTLAEPTYERTFFFVHYRYYNSPVQVTAQQGYEVSGTENGVYANSTSLLPEDGELTVFVKNTADGTLACAVVKNIWADTRAPEIRITAVDEVEVDQNKPGVSFSKDMVRYTINVSDDSYGNREASGVDQNSIQYYVGAYGISSDDLQQVEWKAANAVEIEDGSYTFAVEAPAAGSVTSGYLYVKAQDNTKNVAYLSSVKALVLEKNEPSVSVVCSDNSSPKQKHTIQIEAKDAAEQGQAPYQYSGIADIRYTLKQGDAVIETGNLSEEINTPKKMEDVGDNWNVSREIVLGKASYNGTYDLVVTVRDFCGNETEETISLVYDNTVPKVTVEMPKQEADDTAGDYYYNNHTWLATVTFEDEYLAEGGQYEVLVKSETGFNQVYTLTETEGNTGTVVISAEDAAFAQAADGRYTIAVTAVDSANNAAQNMEKQSFGFKKTENGLEGEFCLDNTAPVLVGVEIDADGNYYSEDNAVYYPSDFYVSFTVEEANLNVTDSFSALTAEGMDNVASDVDTKDTVNTLRTVAVYQENVAKAVYTAAAYAVDKAGNRMVLAENLEQNLTEETQLQIENGKATLSNALVLDTVAPVVTLQYSALDNDHYYVEGNTVNAYYNETFEAQYLFEDAVGFGSEDVRATVYKDENALREQNQIDANGKITYQVVAADESNGRYRFGVEGCDKAGNPLVVYEDTLDGVVEVCADGSDEYVSGYEKVMDTVAPTYTLSITNPDMDNPGAVDGTTVYMNTDIEAVFTVSEINFDRGMIATAVAAVTNTEDYSAAQPDWKEISLQPSTIYEGLTYTEKVSADGVYRFEIAGQDKAGNLLVPAVGASEAEAWEALTANGAGQYWTYNKVRDTKAPQLSITFNDGTDFYKATLGEPADGAASSYYNVTLNKPYRKSNRAVGTFVKNDHSPVAVSYTIHSSTQPLEFCDADYNRDTLTVNIEGEQIFNLETMELRDRAGNVTVLPAPTTKLYLDETAPYNDELVPTVSLTSNAGEAGRGPAGTDLYNKTVTVNATVTDPGESIRSSGLYHVYYKVLVNNEVWTDRIQVASSKGGTALNGVISYGTGGGDYNTTDQPHNETITNQDVITFTADETVFNYNDVKLFVWAEDNAGNVLTEASAAHYYFGIDITKPTISVRYDNNSAQNEKYFKEDRVATVVVTERNFDPDNTKILTQGEAGITGWTYAAGSLENGDDDTWTCTVTYSQDGDYTFDVSTTDIVGWKSSGADYGESVAPQEFTVDKTKPVISIAFDNNDVRNGKYYNRARNATVTIEEHNFAEAGAELVTTANIQEGSVSAPAAGGWSGSGDTYTAQVNFAQDGNYTMNVRFVDLAGNEADPETVEEFVVDTTPPELEISGVEDRMAYNGDVAPVITYHDINCDMANAGVSIQGYKHPAGANLHGVHDENAFGGSFTCDNIEPTKENDDVYTATGSVSDLAGNTTEVTVVFSVNRFGSTYLFGEDTEALLDQYYTNEPQALQVTEINVDSLVQNRVTTSLNGEVVTLQEGTDYTVDESMPGWHQFDYTIHAENFTKEGAYDVTLSSQDEAGNSSSNRAVKENDSQTSDLPISFVVDMTAPVNIVTGVDNNAQYVEADRTVMVNYDDNVAVKSLTLYINDEPVAEYGTDDLQSAGGAVQYVAKASNRWQQFKVVSVDMAGNISEETTVRYLLTSNLFVQYFNNKPLFYGSLGVLALAIVVVVLAVKRKKAKEKSSVNA